MNLKLLYYEPCTAANCDIREGGGLFLEMLQDFCFFFNNLFLQKASQQKKNLPWFIHGLVMQPFSGNMTDFEMCGYLPGHCQTDTHIDCEFITELQLF